MLSEMCFLILVMALSSQSSSLWSCLMIVPFSFSSIFLTLSKNMSSGLSLILFTMVFIGGLLVLILSMASISVSDQSYNFDLLLMMVMFSLILPFIFISKVSILTDSFNFSVAWFELNNLSWSFLAIIILTGLFIISSSIISFKGLIRPV